MLNGLWWGKRKEEGGLPGLENLISQQSFQFLLNWIKSLSLTWAFLACLCTSTHSHTHTHTHTQTHTHTHTQTHTGTLSQQPTLRAVNVSFANSPGLFNLSVYTGKLASFLFFYPASFKTGQDDVFAEFWISPRDSKKLVSSCSLPEFLKFSASNFCSSFGVSSSKCRLVKMSTCQKVKLYSVKCSQNFLPGRPEAIAACFPQETLLVLLLDSNVLVWNR